MRFFAISVLSVCLLGAAVAQQAKTDPYKVQSILDTLAEIDSANQVLPLLLTKDQIKKLLPVLEKCRNNVRNQQKKEADRLKELRVEADKIDAEAIKGLVPSQEFLDKVDRLFKKFDNERTGVTIANGLILRDALKDILNDGQRKAAIGVVDKIFNAQDKKWEEGTPDLKLQYFALSVLMGDRTYDLLTKLSLSK